MSEVIQYQPQGVCCQFMQVKVNDSNIIEDVDFLGGCNGNLKGIRSLVIGMNIDDVISKLQGIQCRDKSTSCPDQLAQCLAAFKAKQKETV